MKTSTAEYTISPGEPKDRPTNGARNAKNVIPGLNILVLGVSCFDGMASSMRVRNLIEPLVEKELAEVYNLIYDTQTDVYKSTKSGKANGIRFNVLSLRVKNIFSIFSFIYRGIISIRNAKSGTRKNVIYNYDYPDAKNILFLLYAKWIGYTIVVDIIEDNRFITSYNSVFNRFRMATSKLILKLSPSFTSAYVAISKHLSFKMQAVGKGKIPVHLIPVSVNFKYFERRSWIVNPNDIKIFYGGSFGKKDGLPVLIKAFDDLCARHNNISLVLTGKGLPSDMNEIFALISGLKSKDRIIYKGFLDTNTYYALLNSCDIFCMTRTNSKYANAGFPFKLGEFLATGKAVVATKIGDVPDYLVNHSNALLIEPDSVSELVSALTYIVNNPSALIPIGIESRKTAEKYFDSEKLSMQLLSIFQSS